MHSHRCSLTFVDSETTQTLSHFIRLISFSVTFCFSKVMFRLMVHHFDIVVLIQTKSQDVIKTLNVKRCIKSWKNVRIAVTMSKATFNENNENVRYFFLRQIKTF